MSSIWHGAVIALTARYTAPLDPRAHVGTAMLYYAASMAVAVVASTVIALLSWYLLEQPFVRLKRFVRYA